MGDAVTVLLTFVLTLGIPASPDPAIAAFLASEDLKPLAHSATVRVARVDNFLPPGPKAPTDAESLELPGIFRVRPNTALLAANDAALVRSTLRMPSTYESYVTACMFEPGVAFTFPSRSDLLVLVCFKCEEVAFVKGTKTLKKLSLSTVGKRQLWDVTVRSFPELRKGTGGRAAEQ